MDDKLIGSTMFGQRLAAFIDQFRQWPQGAKPPGLVLTLHPALHDRHLADTVHDLAFTKGVADIALIRPPDPIGPSAHLAAAMAGFSVRTIPTIASLQDREDPDDTGGPYVIMYHHPSRTALIQVTGSGFEQADQASLHLGELVSQALRHLAETDDDEGTVDLFNAEDEIGLHCWRCKLTQHPAFAEDPIMCTGCGNDRDWVYVATRDGAPPPVASAV